METNLEKPQNKYRYERKYILDSSEYDSLVHQVLADGLSIPFPPRKINNLYFDSFELDSYFENVEGESKRNKYRLRWYGERFQTGAKPTFEVKMKKDQVNKKKMVKLAKTDFTSFNDIHDMHEHVMNELEEKDINIFLEMQSMNPAIINGYDRDYFLSPDKQTRLTIDRNMSFYNCKNHQEALMDDVIIVEVKYPVGTNVTIDFERYKLTLAKSSKYVTGLDLTAL